MAIVELVGAGVRGEIKADDIDGVKLRYVIKVRSDSCADEQSMSDMQTIRVHDIPGVRSCRASGFIVAHKTKRGLAHELRLAAPFAITPEPPARKKKGTTPDVHTDESGPAEPQQAED